MSLSFRPRRTVCWVPLWNKKHEGVGLEHLLLGERDADGVVLAVDEDRGAFRLAYQLRWDEGWRLRRAELVTATAEATRELRLSADGQGRWWHADGRAVEQLEGCIDIDIWPTPFTNTFPIQRCPMTLGERRRFRMAWVDARDLSFEAQPQAYTRVAQRGYLFENLDGSGFQARLLVDGDGLVIDYPDFFRRWA